MKRCIRHYWIVFIFSSLAGCGFDDLRLAQFLATAPAFSRASLHTPDLEPIYASFCNNDSRSLQHVVPVDMNKDGRMDLLLWLWCSPVSDRSTFIGPTPSRLVVFLQNSQGIFRNGTAEIFGKENVQPGGSGEYYVTGDFNQDGYTDIFWTAAREDGRGYSDWSTQWSANIAVMSQGNGTYRLDMVGSPNWNSGVSSIDNAQGGLDLLASSNSDSPKRWRYDLQTGWINIPGYEWTGGNGTLFLSRTAPNKESTTALVTYSNPTELGIKLYTYLGGSWNSSSKFSYPASVSQKKDTQTEPTPAAFVSIEGIDYIDPSFSFTCQIKRAPSSAPEFLTVFEAQKIIGGYHGQVIVYYSPESPLEELFKIMSFSPGAQNELVKSDLVIRNEVTSEVKANRMACLDLNGDNYDDIILYVSKPEQTPIIYLNDRNGRFDRVRASVFPTSPSNHTSSNYVFADINNDGAKDLIYFQINGQGGSPNQLTIYKANRQLNFFDVIR
jgi:hypothetical protein